MRLWGLIPARGGSKSIPLKNLADLGGRPLIDYVILAARAWGQCERLVCSTDHDGIAARCETLGVEVDMRPGDLGGDDVRVADVARELVTRRCAGPADGPDWIVLLQPTSPFVRVEHLEALSNSIASAPHAASAQNVVPVPHNHHAWNQRLLRDGEVSFVHAAERSGAFSKQRKPPHYVFGNLVAVRTRALLDGGDFFASPSAGVVIERPYDFDVDGPEDLVQAQALLAAGCVELPHLTK